MVTMANSRNVSKVALIPRPQVPQGRVVDSGGCYNVVGAGETEKPRARSPAHFEHEANIVRACVRDTSPSSSRTVNS